MSHPDTLDDYRFYAERLEGHALARTVCAVHRSRTTTTGHREALVAVTDSPDGPLAWSTVAPDFLRRSCREVSLTAAAGLHPALVSRLVRDLSTP